MTCHLDKSVFWVLSLLVSCAFSGILSVANPTICPEIPLGSLYALRIVPSISGETWCQDRRMTWRFTASLNDRTQAFQETFLGSEDPFQE